MIKMNARDIMRKEVVTIDPGASIHDAISKLMKTGITSLIVEKTSDGNVYGIVTRKDIVNKVIAYGKDMKTVRVSEIMSEPILSISPQMSVETVARLMAKTDIRRFPIIEDGRLVGLISNSDILKAMNRNSDVR